MTRESLLRKRYEISSMLKDMSKLPRGEEKEKLKAEIKKKREDLINDIAQYFG
jgi:hypothetical protein